MNFALSLIIHTFVAENCLDEEGKIDFIKVNPVLFEAPHATYLSLGKPLAKCWEEGLKFN